MTRQEFIEGLGRALSGKLDANRLNEIIKYYEDFIMAEVRKGKSEEEVLQQLGDPRLIAKSILAAETNAKNESDLSQGAEGDENYRNTYEEQEGLFVKFMKLPKWLKAVIIGTIILVILSIVFRILAFLLPIIIPTVCVLWLINYFKDK